jgi:leucyl/phenylalanyl-tRNA--protein transferase
MTALYKSQIEFPDPLEYDFPEWIAIGDYFYNARDIIHFGGELNTVNLLNAYARGIFPWPIEGCPLPWFCPARRAILEFAEIRISRSVRRAKRDSALTFTIDKAFEEVMSNCASVTRKDEQGTWISEDFIREYARLHSLGNAHSVEAWAGNKLVGGIYGVDAGGVFCGESMFHLQPNASKLAILFLVEYLAERGANWLDIQVMTPHMHALGAREISRKAFIAKLRSLQTKRLKLFDQSLS